jgi:hydroxyacylglutathione hydrolase
VIVEQIYTDNAYRNFNYLIACPETGEALAIDPLASDLVLARAKEKGWTINQVLNTHEHQDHTGGNDAVIAASGAKLLAHHGARNSIPDIDIGLSAGDVVKVGRTVDLEALDTPGHTMSHICLLSRTDRPALICGDTLFNAKAREMLPAVEAQDPHRPIVTTLALEKEINTFFRLHSPTVIARLRETFPDLPDAPTPKQVFVKLRALRNDW